MQLDGREIFVNVRMIEFQRRENHFLRMVVQKFWRFVEKRGIVFVALQHKFFSSAQAKAASKIFGHAADQEIRMPSGVMQNPGQHGRRCRFAVRSSYHQRIVARQEKFFQRLRERAVRNLIIQHRFHFRIAARKRIADHDDVRRGIEICGVETIVPGNAKALQQRRRGRIHACIGTRHAVAAFRKHSGQWRHGRAANSREMKMQRSRHARTAGSKMSMRPSPLACSLARTPSGMVSMGRCVWPTGDAVNNGNFQRAEHAFAYFRDRHRAAFRRFGIRKFSQDDSAYAFKFSRLLQMQQHAIELIGFHSAVFQQQNRAARIEFPRRADRRFNQRDASAQQRFLRPCRAKTFRLPAESSSRCSSPS